jgi:hypothetical protein
VLKSNRIVESYNIIVNRWFEDYDWNIDF